MEKTTLLPSSAEPQLSRAVLVLFSDNLSVQNNSWQHSFPIFSVQYQGQHPMWPSTPNCELFHWRMHNIRAQAGWTEGTGGLAAIDRQYSNTLVQIMKSPRKLLSLVVGAFDEVRRL